MSGRVPPISAEGAAIIATKSDCNKINKQENGRTVRLCPSLRKTTTMSIYFAHASSWLFIISITKPFLDFIHLLLKYRSRTKSIHLSLKKFK